MALTHRERVEPAVPFDFATRRFHRAFATLVGGICLNMPKTTPPEFGSKAQPPQFDRSDRAIPMGYWQKLALHSGRRMRQSEAEAIEERPLFGAGLDDATQTQLPRR